MSACCCDTLGPRGTFEVILTAFTLSTSLASSVSPPLSGLHCDGPCPGGGARFPGVRLPGCDGRSWSEWSGSGICGLSLMHYTQSTPTHASTTLKPPVFLETLPNPAVLSPPPVHNIIFQTAIQKLHQGPPDSEPVTKRTKVRPSRNGRQCPRDQPCDQIRVHQPQRTASEGAGTEFGVLNNDSTAEPRNRAHSPRVPKPDLSDHARPVASQIEPIVHR